MRNWLVLGGIFLAFQVNAHAMNLDSYIDYTGVVAEKASDTPLGSSGGFNFGPGLGGPVGNDYVVEDAFQFTVSEPLKVNHLSVDATQIRSVFAQDPSDPDYNTPEKMKVSFQLYSANNPKLSLFGVTPDPNSLVVSKNHTFTIQPGEATKDYNNVHIRFKTELEPGNDYWLVVTDPQFSGSTLDSTANFMGKVATPEPSTWIFFSSLILLVFCRGYYSRKVLA